ncbi:hypothetical protein HME9302_00777 [Alteripontixanthobacter maritimus]|uniref:procollagen-proline 3-dioxygenase n=2 Tax=Alteripontixanthobacter maritimus TaxID=2161824 RepID=A0A369Q8K0_9SPHN|nr:hypothetical protein HME9302_00777 [Alteripontixanthobacter maritimus]
MLSARSLTGKPIGIVEDFITEQERKQLLFHAKSPKAQWDTSLPTTDVWHGRMINPSKMPAKTLKLMEKIRRRAAKTITAHYGIVDSVYADTLQLVRWRPGDSQAPHADCEHPNGKSNEFPWRAFASIIYLNDEFTGGEIHFPVLGMQPTIKPRMLAYFPSTAAYLHGVKKITSGMRYTHSCFYTFDPTHHDGHSV